MGQHIPFDDYLIGRLLLDMRTMGLINPWYGVEGFRETDFVNCNCC